VSSQKESNSEESHLIEDDKVMVDMKEETSNHIDTKDENTIGGRNDEEAFSSFHQRSRDN
jgi:hypothetical protein